MRERAKRKKLFIIPQSDHIMVKYGKKVDNWFLEVTEEEEIIRIFGDAYNTALNYWYKNSLADDKKEKVAFYVWKYSRKRAESKEEKNNLIDKIYEQGLEDIALYRAVDEKMLGMKQSTDKDGKKLWTRKNNDENEAHVPKLEKETLEDLNYYALERLFDGIIEEKKSKTKETKEKKK